MAGLIKREDIDEVRQRTDIKEVVDGYVTLKGAGLGSYKGLCPFHDERSPSFTVRPQVGRYHCFGCGEDGDVISFVQKLDHISFHEAVEKLSAPKSVALGAVYATLDRLEDKGLVSSWLSDPTPERGGRSKRHYQLEQDGKRALRESVLAARRVCDAVAEVWGDQQGLGKWKPVRQK